MSAFIAENVIFQSFVTKKQSVAANICLDFSFFSSECSDFRNTKKQTLHAGCLKVEQNRTKFMYVISRKIKVWMEEKHMSKVFDRSAGTSTTLWSDVTYQCCQDVICLDYVLRFIPTMLGFSKESQDKIFYLCGYGGCVRNLKVWVQFYLIFQ